jgi:hypothetical protein
VYSGLNSSVTRGGAISLQSKRHILCEQEASRTLPRLSFALSMYITEAVVFGAEFLSSATTGELFSRDGGKCAKVLVLFKKQLSSRVALDARLKMK